MHTAGGDRRAGPRQYHHGAGCRQNGPSPESPHVHIRHGIHATLFVTFSVKRRGNAVNYPIDVASDVQSLLTFTHGTTLTPSDRVNVCPKGPCRSSHNRAKSCVYSLRQVPPSGVDDDTVCCASRNQLVLKSAHRRRDYERSRISVPGWNKPIQWCHLPNPAETEKPITSNRFRHHPPSPPPLIEKRRRRGGQHRSGIMAHRRQCQTSRPTICFARPMAR